MNASPFKPESTLQIQADKNYQESALSGVSRSFALTIPQLPEALRASAANAYLLCRVADTIEDHVDPEGDRKQALFDELIAAVDRHEAAPDFAKRLLHELREDTPTAERELVRNLSRVLRVAYSLPDAHSRAISRCVRILSEGMARFERCKGPHGLDTLGVFDDYCYHVAGVVGEMLTTLFCDYSSCMNKHRSQLMKLAVQFGQGLQMTNILKDVWEDRARGVCWLPRDVFAHYGCQLDPKANWAEDPAYQAGIGEMVAIAHGHLQAAQAYTLMIPAQEKGLRRFCSWAVSMALHTLRRINRHRDYTAAEDVKISRSQLNRIIASSRFTVHRDWALTLSFSLAARGLPKPVGMTEEDYAAYDHR
ncbi:hypothetical protein CAI21_00130 [Alkalilimnicola ehrlichii]|uniref:Phytoene synthase n=1 Tax=Alkalilimnicola ehrlichii TaxID=351052 RepID=A0A3E0X1W5_9GAMM|nr:phytoene/squalene synthase family protein [Alkalilimnicola ehrlichii]RFA31113.1 hypothetical protein CAI21_00130 [Alkalilimnicola ehrlichii]RFA39601.1 hypothetical protein CAL65_02275 [Alkalilimnicola ehrlichii]